MGSMAILTATLTNRRGLHARASARLARLAGEYADEIWIVKDDQKVPATSIMGLMMLGAACGTELTIEASGPEAEKAVAGVAALIEARFGEDE